MENMAFISRKRKENIYSKWAWKIICITSYLYVVNFTLFCTIYFFQLFLYDLNSDRLLYEIKQ